MKRTITVEGVHCGGCEARLGRALEAIPEIESVCTSRPAQNKEGECRGFAIVALKEGVEYTDEALKAAIEAANFEVISIV